MDSWDTRILDAVDKGLQDVLVLAPPGFGTSRVAALVDEHLPELDVQQIRPGVTVERSTGRRRVLLSRFRPPGDSFRTIDYRVLALTRTEALDLASELEVDESVAEVVHLMTRGWRLYYESCLEVARNGNISAPREVIGQLRAGPHLADLATACVGSLSSRDRVAAQRMAALQNVPGEVIEILGGPGAVARLQHAGLPLVEARPGWFKLLPPGESFLDTPTTIDEPTANEISVALATAAGTVRASQILLQAGAVNTAARLLARMPVNEVDEADTEQLGAALTTILDSEKDDGVLHLLLARVHHNAGDLDMQREALLAAAVHAREQFRLDIAAEASAEVLMVDLPTLSADEAASRHKALQDDSQEHWNERAGIRFREISEALQIQSYDLAAIYKSVPRMQAIAMQWQLIGEKERAAATTRMLVATSFSHLGRYKLGAKLMTDSAELVRGQPQAELWCLSLLTRMNALAADLDAFEESAERTARMSRSIGLPWIDAYLAWSNMIASGHRRDTVGVRSNMRLAESLLGSGVLHDGATGVIFHADAARAYALCGQYDEAQRVLELVRHRKQQDLLEYGLSSFFVGCRATPSNAARFAEELAVSVAVPAERQWTIDLELALASGEPPSSRLVAGIVDEASIHNAADLAASIKNSFARENPAGVLIRVFGTFEVEVGGQVVAVPREKVAQLIKFLAVRGKPVATEVVIDQLWPDVLADLGAQRLRNVIGRARTVLGPEGVLRVGDSLLLGKDVDVDLSRAECLLAKFKSQPTQSADALRLALDLYRGPILELDLYEDWVSSARQGYLGQLSVALRLALEAELLEPDTALDEAIRIESDDRSLFRAILDSVQTVDDETVADRIREHLGAVSR